MRGETKPHRTTRFVLVLITALGTSSLLAQHDRVAVWFLGICAVQCVVVFLLSLRYGVGGWARSDLICLLIACLGIVIWKITNNAVLGLYAAILADMAGMIPTLIKTYHRPRTEYWLSYVFDIAATACTLLAIEQWRLEGFSYPLYLLIINLIVLLLILRPKLIGTSMTPKP